MSEITYPPGTEISAHAHELPYFCLLLKGSYFKRLGSRLPETEALDFIFHPSGEVQSQRFRQAGGRCLAIELGQEASSNRLVVRGGYGVFYTRPNGNAVLQTVVSQPFVSINGLAFCRQQPGDLPGAV